MPYSGVRNSNREFNAIILVQRDFATEPLRQPTNYTQAQTAVSTLCRIIFLEDSLRKFFVEWTAPRPVRASTPWPSQISMTKALADESDVDLFGRTGFGFVWRIAFRFCLSLFPFVDRVVELVDLVFFFQ
jgi:hypothetical protein